MPLRQINVYLPRDCPCREFFDAQSAVIDHRDSPVAGDQKLVSVLVEAEESEGLIDEIFDRFSTEDEFRLTVHAVRAALPRTPAEQPSSPFEKFLTKGRRTQRTSREELYQNAVTKTSLTPVYLLLMILAAGVAANGFLTDNLAVVIGAMLIAPIFEPNMALSMATTMADKALARQAAVVLGTGLLATFAVSIVIGIFVPTGMGLGTVAARTQVVLGDVALGLIAGAAGAITFTQGMAGGLVGVIVAAAIVPSLVVCGLLLGNGAYADALGAGLIMIVNLMAINLAGVATFLAQGIHPRGWREKKQARHRAWQILIMWLTLVLILAALVYYTF